MYKLIYTVQADSCGGFFALLGIVPIVIGAIIVSARQHLSFLRLRGIWYPASMMIGGCVWSMVGLLFFLDCRSLSDDLRAGRTEIREGVVQRYRETAKEATFTVSDRSFSVLPYRIGGGYKRLRRDGSPLQDGVRVRVHSKRQEILMLELGL